MKRFYKLTALLSAVALMVCSCPNQVVTASAASKIKLNKTKLTLRMGKSSTLKLKGVSKSHSRLIRWKSSKKKIATVSSSGRVIALKKGKTVVTATYGGKKYKCVVTVKVKHYPFLYSTSKPSKTSKPGKATTTPTAVVATPATSPALVSATPNPVTSQPAQAMTSESPASEIQSPAVQTSDSPEISEISTDAAIWTPVKSPATSQSPTLSPVTASAVSTTTASPAGVATSSPYPEESTSPFPEDVFTPLPADPDEMAENMVVYFQKADAGIQMDVRNENQQWISQLNISCTFMDSSGNEIDQGDISTINLAPEQSRSLYISLEDASSLSQIDLSKTVYTLESTLFDENETYVDCTDDITVTKGEIDNAILTASINFNNSSEYTASVVYSVWYFDDDDNLVGVNFDTLDVNGLDNADCDVEIPSDTDEDTGESIAKATRYEVRYSACYLDEDAEANREAELINGVSISSFEILGQYVQIKVTNNNTVWVNEVNVDYSFCDSQGNSLGSASCVLPALEPGKSQTAIMDVGETITASLDQEHSQVSITLEDNSQTYVYTSRNIICSKTLTEGTDYEISFSNKTAFDVEGTYIVYFYDKSKKLVYAETGTFSAYAKDTDSVSVSGPYTDTDDEGNPIPDYNPGNVVVTVTSAYSVADRE